MSRRTMLQRALAYVARGLPVFPLHEALADGTCSCPRGASCDRPGKHPRNRRGHNGATTDHEQIRRWWEVAPNAGIGFPTGGELVGGGWLLVVDVDGVVGKRTLRALVRRHGPLPATVEATTGGAGRHLFFATDRPLKGTSGKLGPKLDTRAAGGYVILPPSQHRSGRRYRWRRGLTHDLAAAPKWLVDLLSGSGGAPCAVPSKGQIKGSREQHRPPPRRLDRSSSGVDFATCLTMLREGADDEAMAAYLRRRSSKVASKGPSADDYVRRTIANARATHEANAPRSTVRRAMLHRYPARHGYAERTHVALSLISGDGEVIEATIIVPSPGYERAADTWHACFADVDPALLTARWPEAVHAFRSIRWRGRELEVATRGGSVVWIRAADALDRARQRRAAGGAR